MQPVEFWRLTWAEFYYMVQGYQRKRKQDMNDRTSDVWLGEALARQKVLPKLESLLSSDTKKKEQSPEEMMAMAKFLNSVFGGEVVES